MAKKAMNEAAALVDVWAAADGREFLHVAERLVRCRNQRDFASLPRIGKIVVVLFRLELIVEVEGLYQFLEYDAGSVEDGVAFLREIGAKNKAAMLEQAAIDPEGEWQWERVQEDTGELLRTYCLAHRQEFEELLAQRNVEPDAIDDSHSTGDEIRMLALSGEAGALLALASDAACPTKEKALAALYAIAGSAACDLLAGKRGDVKDLNDAILHANLSQDPELAAWAKNASQLLSAPEPETIMRWMGGIATLLE
jgi:hypothetical protein